MTRDYVQDIKSLLLTIQKSEKIHALIVEGPAGWGKTTAVDEGLAVAGVQSFPIGSYSTALNLFNFLFVNAAPGRFVVIDDSAGLYSDAAAMAILKAATWPQGGIRRIRWGSTTGKAVTEEFEFHGKLIIICNGFPRTTDAEAVRSRSFPCRIEVSPARARELLRQAALDTRWYPRTDIARSVAKFLCERIADSSTTISYRTLQMGYELAAHNPESWKALLEGMIPAAPEDPKKLVRALSKRGVKVKEQLREFETATGLKRRTFFKYRRELDLSQ